MSLRDKLPKYDLTKTEDKLKFFILVSGLLIFIGVVSIIGMEATMTPNFCAKCHVMTPEYQTWAATSHSNISCTDCHIEPGLGNLVAAKAAAMKELYRYVTDTYPRPLKMKHPIDNKVCEQCHSIKNRNFTTSGDIIIPHTTHLESKKAKVYCVSCHAGVAHGKISGRGVITEADPKALYKGDLAKWTFADGKAQTAKDYTKADMNDCIACHMELKVSIKCETCHQTIKTPDNHASKESWLPAHGVDAQKDINVCKSCHTYGVKVVQVKHPNKAAAYAWGNSYCVACHSKAPTSHTTSGWRKSHQNVVVSKGKNNCLACHNEDSKVISAKAPATTTCDKCH
ncbi:MAG: cytochrome c3 family protein [Thermincolia bacterium]